VGRYGKQILIELDRGFLLVRLGMTGALLVDRPAGPHTRAVFQLSESYLLFDDIRQFGWLEHLAQPPDRLGPDPFEISDSEFAALVRSRRTLVKAALLDQALLRGVGNIYADEALFRAGIHPQAKTHRLTVSRATRLHRELVNLLTEAIAMRGSSVSDYVDASGEKGSFQLRHQVYRKLGEPCSVCGAAIQRIVVNQRGSHYCPHCQQR